MFFLKKLVAALMMPMTFGLGLAVIGLALLWLRRRERLGRIVCTAGVGVVLLSGYGIPARPVMHALERRFGVASEADTFEFIVVLGGGYSQPIDLPPRFGLNDSSLARVVEGVRLYRQHPGRTLVLSGRSVSLGMRSAAESLGVPASAIIVEDQARDTKEEAEQLAKLLGDSPFALVTSASHMVRSVGMFRRRGMNPVPAPCRFLVRPDGQLDMGSFFPGSGGVCLTERTLHETLGILWATLRGQM